MEALRKKYRQDETQFTTKIGGKKTSLGPSYFTMEALRKKYTQYETESTAKIGGKKLVSVRVISLCKILILNKHV